MTTTPSAAGGGGHTAGPWAVAIGPGTSGAISHSGGFVAFTAIPRQVSEDRLDGESWLEMRERTEPERIAIDAEQEANRRLIAAAPDLLEALQELVQKFDIERQWHSAKGGDDYPDSTEIARARIAISAATGASQ